MRYKRQILSVFLVFVFWRLFLPYPHVASDLHHLYPQGLEDNFITPPTFRDFFTGDGLGERLIYSLWGWVIHPFFAFFGKLGIDFTYQMMLFGFLPILVFSVWGIYKILDQYKIGNWGKIIGAFFYVANSYLILLIDGGQITLALAYSLIPLAFYYFVESIDKPSLFNRLMASLVFLGISIFDPRVLYLLGMILLIKLLFQFFSEKKFLGLIKNYFLSGIFIFVMLLLFHLYWLLPAFFTRSEVLPQAFARAGQVEFLSFANLGHSLFLQAPHWFKNVFGKISPLSWEFVLIPFLVFLTPILKPKSKTVAFWLMISLLGIFLAKGVNEPFGVVYSWLFTQLPGFSFFRDSTKFFFLITLSYTVLIGITTDELNKRFKWKMVVGKWKIALLPLLFASYFIILSRPIWLGQMTGTFAKPIYQEEYSEFAKLLESDKEFSRTFWIPRKAPLGYAASNHPATEAFKFTEKRPFASAISGTYELFNFLRAPYMGQLFDVAGIGYIIYSFPDERREELKPDNIDYYNWFTDKIASFTWTEEISKNSPVKVFKTTKHQDRFFVASNAWWVVGADDIYSELIGIEGFELSQNALIFAEEEPGLMEKIDEISTAGIIFNKKSEEDLVGALINETEMIFPAKTLDFSPNPSISEDTGWPASRSFSEGWWKRETQDLISWRGFLQQKYELDNQDFDYGGGWAVGEGNRELELAGWNFEKGNVFLARVMLSPKGGKLSFYQDGKLIGEADTRKEFGETTVFKAETAEGEETIYEYDKAYFGWFEIGMLMSNSPILIKTEGEINVVNALAQLSPERWEELKRDANNLLEKRKVIIWGKDSLKKVAKEFVANVSIQINYQYVSPTHYKVNVKGVEGSSVLVFSSTFDPLWQLSGEAGFPVYSLLNGFVIDGDGSFEAVFVPQKYVYPAILLSPAILVILLSGIIILHKKKG